MSTYTIITEEGFQYSLDATTDISYTLSGKSTDNPVESGFVVSDTYVNENDTISMSGVISSTSVLGGANTGGLQNSTSTIGKTAVFMGGLKTLKESGKTFSVAFSIDLPPLTNCVFESLDFSQNAARGTAIADNGVYTSNYEVSWTVKQIRKSDVAEITTRLAPEKAAEDTKDSVQANEKGSQNTKSIPESERAALAAEAGFALAKEGLADLTGA